MTTRLIHIKVVMDMSTEKLLMASKRFFTRRGVPSPITSDNGSSFIVGEEILRNVVQAPAELAHLQTRRQAEEAFCQATNS